MISQGKQSKDTMKVDPMIVSNKYHELSSDFNEILKEQFSNKNIINDFSPFLSNDVLILESTKTSIIILLKNGIVLSIGEESPTLGRRIVDINDKLKPNKIIFKRQVLDISCGRDHCLAKTDEFRIFSWGNNFYGQLGIINFPMTWESNKDEPTELMFFAQKKSLQIKAGQYNSFSIDDENNIYGWGSNEYGQLLVDSDNKKISSPLLLNIKENFEDMLVLTNKKSKYFYILEIIRNKSNLLNPENVITNEQELKQEIMKLTIEINEIIKRNGGVQLKEGETIEEVRLNNIQSLINMYEEKINEIELFLLANKSKGTEQIINSYNKQIEFNTYQEAQLKENISLINSTIDFDILKNKGIDENINRTKQEDDQNKTKSWLEITKNTGTSKTTIDGSNRVISVDELLDRANSELQIQKYHVLNERVRAQEERKSKEKELKNLADYINLFEKVKEEYKKFSEMKINNEKIKDVHHTMIKLEREIQNFDINLLKNLDKMNYDNNSLLEMLEQSLGNIKKLDQKILSMNIDQSNDISKKIITNFYSNSNLAKQNNILMQEIIYHSQSFYHKVFDKLLKPKKIENFTKLKETIDYKKTSMAVDEESENDEEDEVVQENSELQEGDDYI